MKKISGFILLITIFLALTMGVNAQEITEIEISQLNRSSKGIILKQLPYKTGDKYSQDKLELSRKRLFNSDFFNPISFQLSA